MQKITSLLKNLENNPLLIGISLVEGDDFRWDYQSKTIFYTTTGSDAPFYLLHEIGHARLHHQAYPDDIALIAMERAAWDQAVTLAGHHAMTIPDDVIEDALDSYRDWLHARSTCPKCSSTGMQSSINAYECLACHTKWKVNEARSCALRRYSI